MDKARGTIEGAATLGYGNENLAKLKRKTLNWSIYEMGQPLLAFAAPTGYPEVSAKWVSAGALIERLSFAVALTEQNVSDVRVRFHRAGQGCGRGSAAGRARQARRSPAARKHDRRHATNARQQGPPAGGGGTVNVAKLTALILGSPEFQRR